MKLKLFSCTLLLAGALTAQAQHVMDVNTKKLGAAVQPTMYGIFFEDINYAADGGLYAEMVKNRSFEFPERLMGWRAFGRFEVRDDGPFDRNPHYVRLRYSGHNDKFTGLENRISQIEPAPPEIENIVRLYDVEDRGCTLIHDLLHQRIVITMDKQNLKEK